MARNSIVTETTKLETPPKVLVVDDEEVQRILARTSLEQAGFAVEEAHNGADALTQFGKVSPDLILLDVKMPEMNGFSVCRTIRKSSSGQHLPILMLTGLEDTQSIEEAYESGATDFATKPLNWQVLSHRLWYMLRASRSGDQLRRSESRLLNAQRIAHLGYWEWYPRFNEMVISPEMSLILGFSESTHQIQLEDFLERVHKDDRALVQESLDRLQRDSQDSEHEFCVVQPDGTKLLVVQKAEVDPGKSGDELSFQGTVQDVTERKNAEEKIRLLAYYDVLTGLPNRRSFLEQLGFAIARAQRRGEPLALLFLDLDRFKRINDSLGHSVGDKLLKEVANRLLRAIRTTDCVGRAFDDTSHRDDLVSRIGGDEFVVLLSELSRITDAASVAQRVSEEISRPYDLNGQPILMTSSIGIAVHPNDGLSPESLIKNADTAMYSAKERGGNNFQFYSESMNASALQQLQMESRLGDALTRQELFLCYQPQINVTTGAIVGAEALLRWRTSDSEVISPDSFIPLAEETGLIVPIGEWVLRTACQQASDWHLSGYADLRMAVNLSSRQFSNGELSTVVSAALEESRLAPQFLDLELTESVLMEDRDDPIRTLRDLRSMGLRLSIDDFGTGYSSLSYLTRFPLSSLKIDRSFLAEVPTNPEHVGVTKAIIAMARSLRLQVTAEGVETEEALDFLKQEGCDEAQGFYFSKPVTAEEFRGLLEGSLEAEPVMSKAS